MKPGSAAALVLTIALGVGSNAVVYGFVGGLTTSAADMAMALARVGMLLRLAAAAVFVIACANVACLLLARASARARETSVRVALGASRGRLARRLLADSVVISVAGGAFGLVLAMWTADVVPVLFFDRDAAQLVFAPDLMGIVAASIACVAISIACGLLPLAVVRDDRPAAVLQRENAGPSKVMRALHNALVVTQMTLCCVLVITAGLLVEHLRAALQANVGPRGQTPVLATIAARPRGSSSEAAAATLGFFHAVEDAAQSVPGITARAWASRLPGSLPTWQRFRVESSAAAVREATMDVLPFTRASLTQIAVPPIAGRLFGGQDRPEACRVAVVNDVAADAVFDGDAIGRAVDDPAGLKVQIVGVVTMVQAGDDAAPAPPTIFYSTDQTDLPVAAAGPARFHVSAPSSAIAVLDANVVSASYFAALGWTFEQGSAFPRDGSRGCRVAVVNHEAAEQYFDGDAVGAAVIDQAGRRTESSASSARRRSWRCSDGSSRRSISR